MGRIGMKRILIIAVVVLLIAAAIGVWLPHEFKEEKTEKLNRTLMVELGQPIIITHTKEIYVEEKLPYGEAIPDLHEFLHNESDQALIFWTYYTPSIEEYSIVKDFEEGRIKERPGSVHASIRYDKRINKSTYYARSDFVEEGESKRLNGLKICWQKTWIASRAGLTDDKNEWVLVLEITIE